MGAPGEQSPGATRPGTLRCKVSSHKRFEIRSIVSQERFLPAYGTRHLLRIAGLELAGVTSRGGHEAACPEQVRPQGWFRKHHI